MPRQLWQVGLLICQLQLLHGSLLNCPKGNINSICQQGSKHVACEQTNVFDRHCGPQEALEGARIIKIDGNLRGFILQYLNIARDIVASGMVKWKAASAMPLLTWHPYLEEVSTQLAYHCSDAYKYCSNSSDFPIVTTTVIRILSSDDNIPNTILYKLLPVWFGDLDGCKMNEENELVRTQKNTCVGHFIPLITDEIYNVGCAASIIGTKDTLYNISLVCSFSKSTYTPTPYVVASAPNKGCKGSPDFIHKFLCKTNETYPPPSINVHS